MTESYTSLSYQSVRDMVIGSVTEYYTSFSFQPLRYIAKWQETSAATAILLGVRSGLIISFVT